MGVSFPKKNAIGLHVSPTPEPTFNNIYYFTQQTMNAKMLKFVYLGI